MRLCIAYLENWKYRSFYLCNDLSCVIYALKSIIKSADCINLIFINVGYVPWKIYIRMTRWKQITAGKVFIFITRKSWVNLIAQYTTHECRRIIFLSLRLRSCGKKSMKTFGKRFLSLPFDKIKEILFEIIYPTNLCK